MDGSITSGAMDRNQTGSSQMVAKKKTLNGGNDKLNGENQTSQLKLYKITSSAMQGSNKSNNKSKRNQISPAQTVDQKNMSVGGNEKLQRKQWRATAEDMENHIECNTKFKKR